MMKKNKYLSIRINSDEENKIVEFAEKLKCSKTDVVRAALYKYIDL